MRVHTRILENLSIKESKPVDVKGILKENEADNFYNKCNELEGQLFKLRNEIKDEEILKDMDQLILDFNSIRMDYYKKLNGQTFKECAEYVLKEEINTSKENLNTGVLPVINVGLYGWDEVMYGFEFDNVSELDEGIKEVGSPIVEEQIQQVLPSAKVTPTGVYHPREYNFATDELEFDLEYNLDEMKALEKKYIYDNADANSNLKDKFKSYDGFISFMADNLDEYETQDEWKKIATVLTLALDDVQDEDTKDRFQDKWYEDFYSYMCSNFLAYEEDSDEEEMNESVVIKSKNPEGLYRELLNYAEMYNEAMSEDYDDVFGGTEDSYASEMLDQNLGDLVVFKLGIEYDDPKYDTVYTELYNAITSGDDKALRKICGLNESATNNYEDTKALVDDASRIMDILENKELFTSEVDEFVYKLQDDLKKLGTDEAKSLIFDLQQGCVAAQRNTISGNKPAKLYKALQKTLNYIDNNIIK